MDGPRTTEPAALVGMAGAREGWASVRARWRLVLVLALVGLILGGLLSNTPEIDTTVQATVNPEPLGANETLVDLGISTPLTPQGADFVSDSVLRRLAKSSGHSRRYLLENIYDSQPPVTVPSGDSPIILTAATDSTAESRRLIELWLQAIKVDRLSYVDRVISRAQASIEKRLRRATKRGMATSVALFSANLDRLALLRDTVTVDYRVVRIEAIRALPGRGRARLKKTLRGAIGGLLAGIALAMALATLDRRLRTEAGLIAAFGLPVLGNVRRTGALPSSDHARALLLGPVGEQDQDGARILVTAIGNPDVADRAVAALEEIVGDAARVEATEPLGAPGLIDRVTGAPVWAVAASAGEVTRTDVEGLRAELDGIDAPLAGLLIV